MNKIANRAVMCEVLKEAAAHDPSVVVLCSYSRGSASLTPFANAFPAQFVETGIAVTQIVDPHPVNLNTFASEIVLPSYERMDDVAVLKVF